MLLFFVAIFLLEHTATPTIKLTLMRGHMEAHVNAWAYWRLIQHYRTTKVAGYKRHIKFVSPNFGRSVDTLNSLMCITVLVWTGLIAHCVLLLHLLSC